MCYLPLRNVRGWLNGFAMEPLTEDRSEGSAVTCAWAVWMKRSKCLWNAKYRCLPYRLCLIPFRVIPIYNTRQIKEISWSKTDKLGWINWPWQPNARIFGCNKKNGIGMPKGMSDVVMLSIDKAFIVSKKISSIKVSLVFNMLWTGWRAHITIHHKMEYIVSCKKTYCLFSVPGYKSMRNSVLITFHLSFMFFFLHLDAWIKQSQLLRFFPLSGRVFKNMNE